MLNRISRVFLLTLALSMVVSLSAQTVKVKSKEEAEKLKKEQQLNNKVKKLINEGNNSYRLRQYNDAIAKYEEVIRLDPNYEKIGKVYQFLAISHTKGDKRDYKKAEDNLKKAIAADPDDPQFYYYLGTVYKKGNNLTDAVNYFNIAIQKNPAYAKPYFELGRIYADKNKFKNTDKAVEYFSKAIEAKPSYSQAYDGLAMVLKEKRQFTDAIEAGKKAVANEKRSKARESIYQYHLGEIYLEAGQYNNAIQAFEACIKLSKNAKLKGGANFNIGDAYRKLNQNNKAIAAFKKAKKSLEWRAPADHAIKEIQGKF
jgi:tetratricopeptide (TPR) repeat protein